MAQLNRYHEGKYRAIPVLPTGTNPCQLPGYVAGWASPGNAYLPIPASRYAQILRYLIIRLSRTANNKIYHDKMPSSPFTNLYRDTQPMP
jgi:hypothetical protein